jgi:hypothetical protein
MALQAAKQDSLSQFNFNQFIVLPLIQNFSNYFVLSCSPDHAMNLNMEVNRTATCVYFFP